MPAISTTRRSCISPHCPRTAGAFSALTRLPVAARSFSCVSAIVCICWRRATVRGAALAAPWPGSARRPSPARRAPARPSPRSPSAGLRVARRPPARSRCGPRPGARRPASGNPPGWPVVPRPPAPGRYRRAAPWPRRAARADRRGRAPAPRRAPLRARRLSASRTGLELFTLGRLARLVGQRLGARARRAGPASRPRAEPRLYRAPRARAAPSSQASAPTAPHSTNPSPKAPSPADPCSEPILSTCSGHRKKPIFAAIVTA